MATVTRRNRHAALDLPVAKRIAPEFERPLLHPPHAGLAIKLVGRVAGTVIPDGSGDLERIRRPRLAGPHFLEQHLPFSRAGRCQREQLALEYLLQRVHGRRSFGADCESGVKRKKNKGIDK